jgi:hypothetical protein
MSLLIKKYKYIKLNIIFKKKKKKMKRLWGNRQQPPTNGGGQRWQVVERSRLLQKNVSENFLISTSHYDIIKDEI